ncbi:MAG: hypothetical protein ABJX32_18850 [Tateyamaria sp.]|uniref:hypothetical protein n=1 Tax=Tateyamaria sp. TaxID=1929288 RepID=UPI00329E4891
MSDDSEKGGLFFVGYLPAPGPLRAFLLSVCLMVVGGLAAAGYFMGTAQDDPGPGAFRFDYGRQTVTGVVEMTPYPVIHVTEGNDRIKPGDSFLMTAAGKSGVDSRAMPLSGQLVEVSGIVLERGDLYMLQLRGGRNGLKAAEGDAPQVTAEPHGRWQLTGEICDGKCLAGAMRPGRGLAHKACANLCLLGDVPPIFVSSQPVLGEEFLLVTGPDGTRLPRAAYDHVAQFITAEGEITKRGDLLVWEIDVDTIEVTP